MFGSLKKFEKVLSQIGEEMRTTPLNQEKSQKIKQNILAAIKAPTEIAEYVPVSERLLQQLKVVAMSVSPRHFFRILLREKLITLTRMDLRRSAGLGSFLLSRKLAAFVAVFVFVAGVLLNFTLDINRAQASFTTLLESFEGEVKVVRNGQEIPAVVGFLLKGDDIIRTGGSSRAEIRFLDQSLTRLDENTEVRISRLFVNPHNTTETVVELVLSKGRLWARVINLIDDLSRFQVKAESAVAVVKKKAAFDVSVEPKKKAKVSAIQHGVDIVVSTNQKVVETTLAKGYTAEIKDVAASSSPVILPEGTGDENKAWIASNLEQDRVYIADVKKEIEDQVREQVQVLPGNPLYAVKELSHNTQIALTLDEVQRQKKILAAADQKLAEAQALFVDKSSDKAYALLGEFKGDVNGVIEWTRQYGNLYPGETFAITNQVSEMLATWEKQLSLMLPTDSFYPVKEVVEETQVLIAADDEAKAETKLAQAGAKLLEAQELAEQGDTVSAQKQIENYTERVSEVVSDVQQLPEDEQEKALGVILDTKVEDLKILKNISETQESVDPTPPASPVSLSPELPSEPGELLVEPETVITQPTTSSASGLEATVSAARTKTLTELGEAFLQVQKSQTTPLLLQKLSRLKKVGINGKQLQLFDLKLSADKVIIKTEDTVIAIPSKPEEAPRPAAADEQPTLSSPLPVSEPTTPVPSESTPTSLPKADLKTPELPPVQP